MSTDTNTNNNTIAPTASSVSNFLHDQSCDADDDEDGELIVVNLDLHDKDGYTVTFEKRHH